MNLANTSKMDTKKISHLMHVCLSNYITLDISNDSLQGMGDFLDEMASMMSQNKPDVSAFVSIFY